MTDRLPPFTIRLTADIRAKLEAVRKRLGLRSMADAVRKLIEDASA